MVTPLYMRPSSTVVCFSFTSTRLFSISFNLKKTGKVRELVEQFKEIGIVLMRIIPESVSLSKLQIDLASSITLLQNLVFSRLSIASFFNFSDSFVFFSGACLGTSLSFLCSIALWLCILFFFFLVLVSFWGNSLCCTTCHSCPGEIGGGTTNLGGIFLLEVFMPFLCEKICLSFGETLFPLEDFSFLISCFEWYGYLQFFSFSLVVDIILFTTNSSL